MTTIDLRNGVLWKDLAEYALKNKNCEFISVAKTDIPVSEVFKNAFIESTKGFPETLKAKDYCSIFNALDFYINSMFNSTSLNSDLSALTDLQNTIYKQYLKLNKQENGL